MRRLILATALLLPSLAFAQQSTVTLGGAMRVEATQTEHVISFLDPATMKPIVSIDMRGGRMSVSIAKDVSMDDAARLFWTRVAAIAGQPDPFPTH